MVENSKIYTVAYNSESESLLDREMRAAVQSAVERWTGPPPEDNTFSIIHVSPRDNWVAMTVATKNPSPGLGSGDPDVVLDPETLLWLLLVKTDNGWQAALESDLLAEELIDQIPDDELGANEKSALLLSTKKDASMSVDQAYHSYKLPWPAGISWRQTRGYVKECTLSGWHGTGCLGLDFDINVGSNSDILAAAPGTIDHICGGIGNAPNGTPYNDQYYLLIRTDGTNERLGYLHIDGSTFRALNLKQHDHVEQGQKLGQMREGFVSGACGESQGTHIHMQFPSKPFAIDGYTFSNTSVYSNVSLYSSQGRDDTPPHISCSTPETNKWYSTNKKVTCTVSDPDSEVSKVRWGWDNKAPDKVASTSFEVSLNSAGQGKSWLYVQAWNGDGVTAKPRVFGWFGYDTVAPLNPNNASSGCGAPNNEWQSTCNDPAFTWDGATDASGSGVKDYYYRWQTESGVSLAGFTPDSGFDPPRIQGNVAVGHLNVAARDNVNILNSHPSEVFVFRYDSSKPTISLTINNGSSTANTTSVALAPDARDSGSGVNHVRFSNNGLDWSSWQPYGGEVTWTIPALNKSEHTVYVQAIDIAGNISDTASDSILVDLYPVMPHSKNYRICADAVNSAGRSGIESSSYQLTTSVGEPWAGLSEGSTYVDHGGFLADIDYCLPSEHTNNRRHELSNWVIASGGGLRNSNSYILGGTVGETSASEKNEFRSGSYQITNGFWSDIASNHISVPPTTTPTPPPAIPTSTPIPTPPATPNPPNFTVNIDAGEEYTNDPFVTAYIKAPNVKYVRLSNEEEFDDSDWLTYYEVLDWQIDTSANEKGASHYVYAWFKDESGNIYQTYVDDIIYDPIAPEGQIVLLGNGYRPLLHFPVSDQGSGVGEMRVSKRPDFNDTSWQPYQETYPWDYHEAPAYAQFRDLAGNVSGIYKSGAEYPVVIHKSYLPIVFHLQK